MGDVHKPPTPRDLQFLGGPIEFSLNNDPPTFMPTDSEFDDDYSDEIARGEDTDYDREGMIDGRHMNIDDRDIDTREVRERCSSSGKVRTFLLSFSIHLCVSH